MLGLALAAGAALFLHRAAKGRLPPPDANAFRIYVLGESTSAGVPYQERCDFGRILFHLFGGEIGGRRIEVENLAQPGTDAAATLERAREIAASAPAPEAGVVLLYCGHNEFLRFDDPGDLARQERALFDRPLVDAAERERVFEGYARSLEAIVDTLEEAGVPTVLSTQACNLADWEPNRSVLAEPAHAARVRAALDAGEERLAAGETEAALAAFEDALELEPGFAWAWKRAGDCLRRLGRREEARSAFLEAMQHDGNPIGATPRINSIVVEIAARRGVPLIRADEILAAASAEGLPGWDLFWDNVHPTLEGYLAIARGFGAELERRFGARMSGELSADELAGALGFDREFSTKVWHESGRFCYGAATRVWKPDARLARARHYLDEAERLAPDDADVLCSQGVLRLVARELEESRACWRRAAALDPKLTRRRLRPAPVQQLLRLNGLRDGAALFQ